MSVFDEDDQHPTWVAGALCAQVGGDEWFPDKGGSTREAKSVCNGDENRPACPVKAQCLIYALEHDERFGVWGGLSERERRKLGTRTVRMPHTRQLPPIGPHRCPEPGCDRSFQTPTGVGGHRARAHGYRRPASGERRRLKRGAA